VRPSPLCTMRSNSRKEFAALDDLKNSTMSGWPTADLSAATTASNGFELVRLKRSTSTFSILILSSEITLMDKVRMIASTSRRGSCGCRLRVQESPDVTDEDLVVLKQGAVA
jgi:hypothetical protein